MNSHYTVEFLWLKMIMKQYNNRNVYVHSYECAYKVLQPSSFLSLSLSPSLSFSSFSLLAPRSTTQKMTMIPEILWSTTISILVLQFNFIPGTPRPAFLRFPSSKPAPQLPEDGNVRWWGCMWYAEMPTSRSHVPALDRKKWFWYKEEEKRNRREKSETICLEEEDGAMN